MANLYLKFALLVLLTLGNSVSWVSLSSEFQSGDFISAEEILGSGPYPVYGGNGLRGYAKQYNHDGFYALIGRQGALCGNVNTAVERPISLNTR